MANRAQKAMSAYRNWKICMPRPALGGWTKAAYASTAAHDVSASRMPARPPKRTNERSSTASTIRPWCPIPFTAVSDVALLPLQAVSALVHSRRASSVDLVRACLDRITRHDRELGAFITLTAGSALDEAKRADADLANGIDRGPLHGIPVALKDLYDTAGVRTTGGSRIFADRVPDRDCAVVERLRAAGAVFLGKLNLHEWALGVTNQNPHFGPASNPWDPSRIPGGSSGGSAIAVASGFCYVSPGSDTGGSIRIPASLCGVAGFKPTYGRVSLRGGIPPAWTLDHPAP